MQLILIFIAAVIVLALLAIPRAAKSSNQPVPPAQVVVPSSATLQRSWPSKYNGAALTLEFDQASPSLGFPALDAASKDAAKMSIKWQPEQAKFWWKDCTDIIVTANTPQGLVAETHAALQGNNTCVASMKLPAGVPLSLLVSFSQSTGWIQSVDGGHATSDVVTEKVGPDHIVHKHIAGVKYEDITLVAGTVRKDKWIVVSAVPQLPAVMTQPVQIQQPH